ncbi:sulfotransferase [Candidatus Uabimicrobium sp. HlEnr_7]|uniref:sulfotransferase family protein n=1 Tax=Candidatus Uabimicrobium helgolandensis TaxID=3095367 RepID=UPI00355915FE
MLNSKPNLPFRTRILNTIGKLHKPNIDINKLHAQAQKKIQWDNFGDEYYKKGLERVLAEIQKPNINFLGRESLKYLCETSLENRLLLNKLHNTQPQIFKPLSIPPLIVLGLPRSGTTFLHRLLALDSRHRAIEMWELLRPISLELFSSKNRDQRLKIAHRDVDGSDKYYPDFDHIHYIRSNSYEECMWPMGSSFCSWQFWITVPVYDYMHWYNEQDLTKKYCEYVKWLQVFQNTTPNKRLVLKSPSHTRSIGHLVNVLPKAMIVQIHRDPREVASSFNSLTYYSHSIATPQIEVKKMSDTNLSILQSELKENFTARQYCEGNICDVSYSKFIANPVATIQKIYAHFDLEWTKKFSETLHLYITKNKKGKYGRHKYSSDDFGYTNEEIADRFQDYIKWMKNQLDSNN